MGIAMIIGMFYLFGFRMPGLTGKEMPEKSPTKICQDYFIAFKHGESKSVLPHRLIKEVGEWRDYGNGYRGNCAMTKEDLEDWIIQKTGLSQEEFSVVPAYNGFNYIRF